MKSVFEQLRMTVNCEARQERIVEWRLINSVISELNETETSVDVDVETLNYKWFWF